MRISTLEMEYLNISTLEMEYQNISKVLENKERVNVSVGNVLNILNVSNLADFACLGENCNTILHTVKPINRS